MHSVIETPTFLADAKVAGMDADERDAAVLFLAANPTAGDIMAGRGGVCEKFVSSARARARAVATGSFSTTLARVPLFLLNVFAKGDRANLSKAEQNAPRAILSKMADAYRKGPRA
jgi:hypothetical protein